MGNLRGQGWAAISVLLVVGVWGERVDSGDWPTWRGNAGRQAVTAEPLPASLALGWTLELPPAAPAWPEDPRLQFDGSYEPVVADDHVFLASNVNDSVTAYDLNSGARRWQFFAGGPVRFAPVVRDQRVYFGADDGCVYCLNAAAGQLIWKYDGTPNARKVLGSERLVSVWPVRGGPVLEGNKLFFTLGVWPFEGTFLCAIDPQSGQPVPVANQGSTAPVLLKERTPQGYLAATAEHVFVPCGRSTVAVFDRARGEFVPHTYRTSEVTDHQVAVSGRWIVHGATIYDLQTKTNAAPAARHPVVNADTAFLADKTTMQAVDLTNPQLVVAKDRTGKETRRTDLKVRWTLSWEAAMGQPPPPPAPALKKGVPAPVIPPVHLDLLAGRQLIGHRQSTVFALQLADDPNQPPRLLWETPVEGTPVSLVAASGRLLVVTREGLIHCLGLSSPSPPTRIRELTKPVKQTAEQQATAGDALRLSGVRAGYAVAFGPDSARVAAALASSSDLRVLVVESDAKRAESERRVLAEAALYGSRISLTAGSFATAQLPPYVASLVVVTDASSLAAAAEDRPWLELFRVLRPYGGVAVIAVTDQQHGQLAQVVARQQLAGAELRREGRWTLLARTGPLPGSANWTHEYGDPGNTLMSRDELVQAPLGVLWFGGPAASGDLFYNRHFWGPSMAVVDGRMLVQGPKKLSAIDVYTGRVLWIKPLEQKDQNNPGRRGNDFENVLAGYHFVALPDAVYVVQGLDCLVLDPTTGKETARWQLPGGDAWGTIRVQGEVLLAEGFPTQGEGTDKPRRLVALDRRTGRVMWSREANLSFPVWAVGADRVYAFDADIQQFYLDWKRKGLVPKANEIRLLKAFDLRTGEPVWERSTDQVVTWLGYSAEHDVVVASNRERITARRGKDGDELWDKTAEGVGFKGHPESLWDKLIIWKDRIVDQRGPGLAYDLKSGQSVRQTHPATGEPIDWEFTKSGHHCNYAIANPHLLTFRADTAGFLDIETGNTARLEGFRSGCRNSLIPANGVLNSPNFAHGCVCGYSLFTSMAFVHVPQNELWGYNALKPGTGPIRRLGINLGGRGDRVAANGTMWVEYPNLTGTLLGATVKVDGDSLHWFQLHSSFVRGDAADLPWVAASGVEGLRSIDLRWEDDTRAVEQNYRVRLYFVEPDSAVRPGERVFDVRLPGQPVWEAVDLANAAGGSLRTYVRQADAVRAKGQLRIEFTSRNGRAVLSGVEIEAVGPTDGK